MRREPKDPSPHVAATGHGPADLSLRTDPGLWAGIPKRELLEAAAARTERHNRNAAASEEGDSGKSQGVRKVVPHEQARQHSPERKAVEEGGDRGGSGKPVGKQDPHMPQGDE